MTTRGQLQVRPSSFERPQDIAVTANQQTEAYLNTALAERIGFRPDAAFRKQCKIVE